MTQLSDRLNEAWKHTSIREVTRRAGKGFDRQGFYKALNGQHAKRPRDKTLRSWATGLGIDVNELRALVDLPAGEMGVYTGPDESARLNRDQRRALDRLIKTIVTPLPPGERAVDIDGDSIDIDEDAPTSRSEEPRR